ncbi:MAG: Do family serine endopeptidase [Gammaproteobacteria bacterium]
MSRLLRINSLPRLVLPVLLLVSGLVHGALPAAVDGKPLPTLAPVLEKALPGVVNISTETLVKGSSNPLLSDPFFRRFFDLPERKQRTEQSLGSGVIVDADKGYILTNNHVVGNADAIKVSLDDGRSFEADMVGVDPDTDLAVIRIRADKLTALPMADSDRLRVGDFVVAIGNPFGLRQTVTSGIVSALGRSGLSEEGYEDYIQTDASINPGNSGGALIDLSGRLVGINTAIIAPGGGNVGIGFAIPVNMARSIMKQLIEYGEVRRGRLGIAIQELTPELARAMGAGPDATGVVIARVEEGSTAEAMGLKAGDIITAVNGRAVDGPARLRNRVGTLAVGTRLRIDVLRSGRSVTLTGTIAEPRIVRADGGDISSYLAGIVLAEVPNNAPRGADTVVVIEKLHPRSRAAKAGMEPGDVITSLNRRPTPDLRAMLEAVEVSPRGLLVTVRRDGKNYRVLMR